MIRHSTSYCEEEHKTLVSVPGLAEIMEEESCVASELCGFGVFLVSCEAANTEESSGLDDQC